MDLQNRAMATADWLKENTIKHPLGTAVCSAVASRFPHAVERGDAILAAAVAKGERISQHPSISILCGPLRSQSSRQNSGEASRSLQSKAIAAGIGLFERAEAVLGLVLPPEELTGTQIASSSSRGEDTDDEETAFYIPRPIRLQARRIMTIHFSRFARLRIAVTCSREACEALIRRLRSPGTRPIFAKLCVSSMQHQLSRSSQQVTRFAPLAAGAVQRVLGDRLTTQASDIFQRLAGHLLGTADSGRSSKSSSNTFVEEGDEDESLDCTVLHGDCGPVVHVPVHLDGLAGSGYLQPVSFELVERNGFIEYADSPSSGTHLLQRARSFTDGMVKSPRSRRPFSMAFDYCNTRHEHENSDNDSDADYRSQSSASVASMPTASAAAASVSQTTAEAALASTTSSDSETCPSLSMGRQLSDSVMSVHDGCSTFSGTPDQSYHSDLPAYLMPPPAPPPMLPPPGCWLQQEQEAPFCTPPGIFFQPSIFDEHASDEAMQQTAMIEKASVAVQLRNLPSSMTRKTLIRLVNAEGFRRKYRFVYLPLNFTYGESLGYGDILMDSSESAEQLVEKFQGYKLQGSGTSDETSIIEVAWCDKEKQSLDDLIARYRDSPVMHGSVHESNRPALFGEDGNQVKFPPPTKALKRPRIRARKD